ncbi:MAG: asparagine synthase-related protein, partial [Candidatus Binatia bacterium]
SEPPLEPEAYYDAIRETFSRKLPRYFGGREPIGISLTSGLDTRMIMARLPPRESLLPCYTFASTFRDSRDVLVARRVAGARGQPHRVIRVGEEFLARFSSYAERTVYLSDGCADVSRSADLYVNEIARRIAPVRMTGNYGGEVLRRVRMKPVEASSAPFAGELRAELERARETYGRLLRAHPLSFAVFRQAPWVQHGLLALEQTQVSLRSPYLDNELVRTAFRAPQAARADELCLRLIADGDPDLRRIPTDRGSTARGVSGAASRLLRALEVKAEYAYDYGMPQWAAPIDRLLAALRPERLFLGRHKFTHFRTWYRGALAEPVREVLLDPATLSLPFLERKAVERVVNDHLDGRRN